MRLTKVVIFAAFWTMLLLAGCSTTNHAPLPTMVYHDLTSHYNAYFNVNDKLKGVYANLDKTHKDNYKDVLPLFTYSDPTEGKSQSADLDDIEKRSTQSIQLHKVSNWADDHFLIMGKANYIKGDYPKAQQFLKYLTTEYRNGVDYVKERKKMGKTAKPTLKKKATKKPKFVNKLDEKGNLVLTKVDERPEYKLFIHEPARAEALLWLAKTYAADKKYAEAAAVIQYARSDDKFYKNLDRYIEITDAEILLRQKNYKEAIKPLEAFLEMSQKTDHGFRRNFTAGGQLNSLSMIKKSSQRTRPLFILGQIYEMQGDYAKAAYYYKEVLSSHPNYEMEFYAKIRRANLGRKAGGASDEIKKLLTQMSRDGKYRDFLDQIYYELGQIVLSENNRTEARKYFKKSIASSTGNTDQKAQSYLAIGKMDFEEEYYVTAKNYYDSTALTMPKTDTGYAAVEARDKTLDKLVTQINIIYTEDSLQRIANMSEADRRKFIKKLAIAKEREAELNEAEKNSSKGGSSANSDFTKATPSVLPGSGTGTDETALFYFYNTTARSNGYNEFVKKWGRRKLEENWRRKDKSTSTDITAEADSSKGKGGSKDSTDAASAPSTEDEKLLAGLPLTPEKMQQSNAKLVDAYYALGLAYKDDLRSYRKAASAFEEQNKRFPKNKLELEAYYQLYLIAQRTKNSAKEENYKNLILTNYPNSTIAKYLQDPNYLAEIKKKENALTYYYESAYSDYASGLYASAEKKCMEADLQFKENKMKAKFDLLNALILSKENRLEDYVLALNRIISRYPKTPEADQAQTWLSNLNHSKLPQIDLSKQPKTDTAAAIAPATTIDTATKVRTEVKEPKAEQPKQQVPVTTTDKKADTTVKAPAKTAVTDTTKKATSTATTTADNKPVAKDTAAAKPYKPLTKSERLDSIIRADKAAKNKPKESTIISKTGGNKPAADTTTHTTASHPAIKDTASKKATQAKPATKDTTANKSVKPTAKDTTAKKPEVKSKPATKDTLVKKPDTKAKSVAKDTLAKKADAKAKPAAKDTVKPTVTPVPVAAARPTFDTDTLTEVYGKSDGAPHYVLIYFLDPAAFNNTAVGKLENINSTSYEADKLSSRAVLLDKDNRLIHVKGFKNKDAAQAYIAALNGKMETIMPGVKPDQYFMGAISTLNYSTLINSKKINTYMRFHRMNYK